MRAFAKVSCISLWLFFLVSDCAAQKKPIIHSLHAQRDVDLKKPHHEDGWLWNSGFEHVTRIDAAKHIWYAAMKIPFNAIDTRTPAPGNTFRVNLYRTEGPPKESKEIMWQPVMSDTFH